MKSIGKLILISVFTFGLNISASAQLVSSGARQSGVSSGVLQSGQNTPPQQRPQAAQASQQPQQSDDIQRRQMISDFTQQVLYATMLEQTTEVMQRFIQQSNLGLMGNFIELSIQQVAMQTFQQEETMNIIRDVFDQCVDIGMDDFDSGKTGVEVQEHIRETAKVELRALAESRIYQEIMKVVLENSLNTQQQMIAQQVMQQRAQQMVQQQIAMQRAAQEQYMRQMQQQMQQQMIQQQQQQMMEQRRQQFGAFGR